MVTSAGELRLHALAAVTQSVPEEDDVVRLAVIRHRSRERFARMT
jgi:hypothetical protein